MCSGADKSIPYTENEKLLLASLVDKHKIVENKKTDASTIQKKQAEWDAITNEYNAQGNIINTRRKAVQLKKLWNNLKQRKRKMNTESKYNRLLTGGGPEPHVEDDPVMEAVNVATPYADVSFSCPWDTTAAFEKKTSETTLNDGKVKGESCEILMLDFEHESTEIPTISPVTSDPMKINMHTPSSSGVKVNRAPKSAASFIKTEANIRVQKMQESMKQQKEIHNIKIKIENEQLQTAIALRKEAEAKQELAELTLLNFRKDNIRFVNKNYYEFLDIFPS